MRLLNMKGIIRASLNAKYQLQYVASKLILLVYQNKGQLHTGIWGDNICVIKVISLIMLQAVSALQSRGKVALISSECFTAAGTEDLPFPSCMSPYILSWVSGVTVFSGPLQEDMGRFLVSRLLKLHFQAFRCVEIVTQPYLNWDFIWIICTYDRFFNVWHEIYKRVDLQ